MTSPEGEGGPPGQNQKPQLPVDAHQKTRSALASAIGNLFKTVAKAVAGSRVSKCHEEIRKVFTATALSVVRRLPMSFRTLLPICAFRRILPDGPATLEPSRNARIPAKSVAGIRA